MAKDLDQLLRDIDLLIEQAEHLKAIPPRPERLPPTVNGRTYDSFCETFAIKAVLRALIGSVDTIVKVQMAHKVEQDIARLDDQVRQLGGEHAGPEELAQITAYVRHAVSQILG
ncbi:hypothetical protein [Nissabacter sp. SGAir0207]|uniref:hypothetical protein n=1 Tax=Nissabacter sp. SGAir0207 TaxID=2126321 RepID=UPI0010CCB996|nr:hypothetical protein [Nissabacter sp. SGAir0207]QCR37811.1 hypothetical protein C1N62_05790 [Nissabacter sp. SGAir0207]